jgi:hypothetical protein
MDLRAYRTVAFATHALMTGEFRGLSEPALVMTLLPQISSEDDGLLTASEVAPFVIVGEGGPMRL